MAADPDALARWLAVGRARYPDVVVAPEALAAHLERLAVAIEAVHAHAADLYLACGCVLGLEPAIAAFDAEHGPLVRTAARRIDPADDFIEEVVQRTRERLLVPLDGPARIAEYGGQGPLRSWIRVAAVRIALNAVRDRKRDVLVGDDAFFDVVLEGSDEDRRQTRARYGAACSDALRAALQRLTRRERHLLRMHYLHGLTVDELAPSLQVHRATVARWIAAARDRLFEETRAGVRERLGIGADTVDSILQDLQGKIEISVTRLLASEPGTADDDQR
ncbi:MAG TPA: sigma-70 family RNA polymerase sigma factor [Kofleriaceae bacterium]|nr:sigma-70 family RNA polymerase sigma factor [Kofleriaceae bacterium]